MSDTVTKTMRVDKEFVVLVDDYVKLVKDVFGMDVTVNSVLAGSLVTGFGTYLTSFKMISLNNVTFPEGNPFTKEQISKVKLYLNRASNYLDATQFDESDSKNEVEDVK